MFGKKVIAPPIGTLEASGNSSVWEGTLTLSAFDGRFDIRVFGTRDGLAPRQMDAISRVVEVAATLRQDATGPILEHLGRLRDAGLLPSDLTLSQEMVWGLLSPCMIEVHPVTTIPTGEISISIGFETPWDTGGHLLHMRTADAVFTDVYWE